MMIKFVSQGARGMVEWGSWPPPCPTHKESLFLKVQLPLHVSLTPTFTGCLPFVRTGSRPVALSQIPPSPWPCPRGSCIIYHSLLCPIMKAGGVQIYRDASPFFTSCSPSHLKTQFRVSKCDTLLRIFWISGGLAFRVRWWVWGQ